MVLDAVHDKDLEKILKHHCNTPFFRDNPYYIRQWERYFVLCNRDPNILFFMRHKRISKNYHFLYIELSRHFESKGLKDVSVWILQRAIEANVYRNDILVSEILRLGKPPNALTKEEVARELEPQSFVFWGKRWYSKETPNSLCKKFLEDGRQENTKEASRSVYTGGGGAQAAQEHGRGFPEKECSRAKHAVAQGLGILTERYADDMQDAQACMGSPEDVSSVSYQNEERNVPFNNQEATMVDTDAKKQEVHAVLENLPRERGVFDHDCMVRSDIIDPGHGVGAVCVGALFCIENHAFYVKSRLGKSRFLVVKTSEDVPEWQTAELPYHTLQIDKMDRTLFDKFVPEKVSRLGRVLLYKHYELGPLGSAACLNTELNTFFFQRILEIALYYAEKNLFFSDLSTDDFFIDDDMSVVLGAFVLKEKCCVWDYSVFSELKTADTSRYMEMRPEEAFGELCSKLCILDVEVLLLKLKIAILERNVVECINKSGSQIASERVQQKHLWT